MVTSLHSSWRVPVADVFLSYKREDREKAQQIVRAFEAEGFSVWWDNQIEAGQSWDSEIEANMAAASAVVALWSPNSVKSEWVRTEAYYAMQHNKLIPVQLERVELPLAFRLIQTADLTGWNGAPDHRAWRKVVEAVRELTGNRAPSPPRPPPPATTPAPATPPDRRPDDAFGAKVKWDRSRKYHVARSMMPRSVFIAHASADKGKLIGFIETLDACGFVVWVDRPQEIGLPQSIERKLARRRIYYGDDWKEGIRKAIRRSKYVLAFWSRDSIDARREQFHYEVYQGLVQGKLRQCIVDGVSLKEIGMPYTFHQIADLSDFSRGEYHPNLEYLMNDMR